MREVRGSVLVAGVGPQVTTHVPGAGCCHGECLYLPKNRAGQGVWGENVSFASKPHAGLGSREEDLGPGRGIKWVEGV